MTLRQEAISLLEEQPDSNLRVIVDLLKKLKPEEKRKKIRRIGVGRDVIKLPEDFYEHFDDLNEEIALMFYGESE